ncbi:MAG: hypothetical protein HYV90_05225 [Candidatus Woesebacteria bacterium]|nr:MAG: hypothetical protein HYV90_05225 [Candidatus Woesebacteria bacterium]
MKRSDVDGNAKTKRITFFASVKGKGELLEGVLDLVTGIVTVEREEGKKETYRRDEDTKRFSRIDAGPMIVESQPMPDEKTEGRPEFGQLVYFPNGDVGRWQPNLRTGKMELYIQKAKYIASLSPNDASRHGKHTRRSTH